MSKKVYAFLVCIVTAVSGVVIGAQDYFAWPTAVSETANILEGAIIGILGAWTAKEATKKIGE